MSFLMKPLAAAAQLARRLHRRQDGVAAVEFALIVPIMLTMFIGVVELSQAITVDRRVSQIASSTADLVARQRQVTTTMLGNYMGIINQLMAPYAGTPLKMTISNVYNTTAAPTVKRVCWFYQHNTGVRALTKGANYTGTLPTGLLDETTGGTSVVVVEVAYQYTPVMIVNATPRNIAGTNVGSFIGAAGINMQETFYLKPRLSPTIQFETDPIC